MIMMGNEWCVISETFVNEKKPVDVEIYPKNATLCKEKEQ